jgi:hypothetical protein
MTNQLKRGSIEHGERYHTYVTYARRDHGVMTVQPSAGHLGMLEPARQLFTPRLRLGFTWRDPRSLCVPYPEPPPDPGASASRPPTG